MRHRGSKMNKKLIINTLTWNGVALLLFCLLPMKGNCQTGEEAVNTLVKMGFENVGWSEDAKERVYVMENVAYRLNGVGIGKAVDIIQKMGLPEEKPCRIIFLDNNVPQISLYYQPIVGDSVPEASRADWTVGYNLGNGWKQVRKVKKRNSSLFKVDILVYPELSFKNLVITQIYQVLFDLSPAIEVSLWKGMKLAAQVKFPVYNDGYGKLAGKVQPGFIAATQSVRLPYNIFGELAVGTFNGGRYGTDLSFVYYIPKDTRFSLEARIGVTGTYYWNGFDFNYGTKMRTTWSVGGSFYWPKYNLQTTLKAEQYILGEKGVRLDVIRHFRYTSIGFYAMKAKGAKSNGGFRFQVALPPYKYKRRGYIPRVEPSKNMGIAYNAGNERYYYKSYRTMPGHNIMQSNSFNPYFIKSELLNF